MRRSCSKECGARRPLRGSDLIAALTDPKQAFGRFRTWSAARFVEQIVDQQEHLESRKEWV